MSAHTVSHDDEVYLYEMDSSIEDGCTVLDEAAFSGTWIW